MQVSAATTPSTHPLSHTTHSSLDTFAHYQTPTLNSPPSSTVAPPIHPLLPHISHPFIYHIPFTHYQTHAPVRKHLLFTHSQILILHHTPYTSNNHPISHTVHPSSLRHTHPFSHTFHSPILRTFIRHHTAHTHTHNTHPSSHTFYPPIIRHTHLFSNTFHSPILRTFTHHHTAHTHPPIITHISYPFSLPLTHTSPPSLTHLYAIHPSRLHITAYFSPIIPSSSFHYGTAVVVFFFFFLFEYSNNCGE